MSNVCTTAMVTFLGYILLYGVCWGTDKTDIEKYKKKIKLKMKLFLFIMFIICVVCLYKVYINYKMIKEIIKQPPIVFSARFKDGDKGTFKYDIQTKKA